MATHLLLSLQESSALVPDNTPCRIQLAEESRCPTTATKKDGLERWLQHRNISIPPDAMLSQLLLFYRHNRSSHCNQIANIIRKWSYEVV